MMLKEELLHYVWQYQQFDRQALLTTEGAEVYVLRPGFLNSHAGPDFGEARVRIGTLEWAGTIEIHVRSSDWARHRHQTDAAYEGVILHVVWEDDAPVFRSEGSRIPTVVLQGRVPERILQKYETLVHALTPIPCAAHFPQSERLRKLSMLDKALLQRLERKAADVRDEWKATGHDWEEAVYRRLAWNMGFKVNAEPMQQLARALPLKILRKHRNQPWQVEALLFGQAGWLVGTFPDAYPAQLQKEFRFLHHKYQLESPLSPSVWKFARMRPANFPTVRLAQLAALLAQPHSLFALFTEATTPEALKEALAQPVGEYWRRHYHFGKEAKTRLGERMGATSLDNLLVNTAAPVLAAVARERDQPEMLDRAVALLETLPAESNHITRLWNELGLSFKTAADAQGALEWYQAYCSQKQCLKCEVGLELLRR
ncbi:Protein of unknown function [Catalinimonas alkaloidigena]|uniref:DUF2851 domain-containing protein n=1 Tax=Catalinimonas alkaloidigena TaxID=1075417 RepID=A0A1G9DCJ2_9BACT|nr:DUF2851 family protein [Catalinimonas alkaloidigena]SDK61612.1 Protein of unknown function [Catalinimonas alkaloidigena]